MILRPPPRMMNRQAMTTYVDTRLWPWLKDLQNLSRRMTFEENFQTFRVDNLSIPAGQEVAIANRLASLYTGLIPSGRIIVRQTGDANIIDGKSWTLEYLYLLNPSANDAVVSVIFFA